MISHVYGTDFQEVNETDFSRRGLLHLPSQNSRGVNNQPPTLGYIADEIQPSPYVENHSTLPQQELTERVWSDAGNHARLPEIPPVGNTMPYNVPLLDFTSSVPPPINMPPQSSHVWVPQAPPPVATMPPTTQQLPACRPQAADVDSPFLNLRNDNVVLSNANATNGQITDSVQLPPGNVYMDDTRTRPIRVKAPINFAPPPPASAPETRNSDRPPYYSEVIKGIPTRCRVTNNPGSSGTRPRFYSPFPPTAHVTSRSGTLNNGNNTTPGLPPRANNPVTPVTRDAIPEASADCRNDPWPNRYRDPRGIPIPPAKKGPADDPLDVPSNGLHGAIGDYKPNNCDYHFPK
ncbi:proline-rich receptor-like protein kinase PERK9 [Trichoplusia ni]|uniref:Proline-rich receptor-like protein kinase PERK9 n=1 Tax=Trichoplusia ni TaxID=7111 RepID=A0A7E5VIR8_TRINI|nr:proline-rich receptor-like protein kinase PERK9 [Trichoplusia ni]